MSKLYAGYGKYKGKKVLFHADDLYDENGNKKSIGATDVEITAPSTATNGTLSSDDLAILQASKLNGIMFDGERYVAMDIGHDSGFLVYTHVGRDNSVNYYLKCIGITISTLGWVKTSMVLSVDQTYSSSSTNAQSGVAVAQAIQQSVTGVLNTEV